MASAGRSAPVFLRLAGHPVRWRLLSVLATGDYRVRELVALLGEPQNLISYHLRRLRTAGLVTSRRSSHDARDGYYHLDLDRCARAFAASGAALHPSLAPAPGAPTGLPLPEAGERPAVLFACTGNSGRSPIAEALLRHYARGRVDTTSAGSHPKPRVHPHAVRALRERHGIDIAERSTRHLDTLTTRRFDYVITLCDRVREVCPEFPGHPRHIHWSLPDPATGAAPYAAFTAATAEIDTRVRHLLPVLAATTHAPPARGTKR